MVNKLIIYDNTCKTKCQQLFVCELKKNLVKNGYKQRKIGEKLQLKNKIFLMKIRGYLLIILKKGARICKQ